MPDAPARRDPPSPEAAGRVEFPTYRRGRWWPAYVVLLLPFIAVYRFVYPLVRHEINWRAAFGTILYFETYLLFAEYSSLKRGHWVYNEARILGPKVFGIPIEQPLFYYWFPVLLAIVLLLAFRRLVIKRGWA